LAFLTPGLRRDTSSETENRALGTDGLRKVIFRCGIDLEEEGESVRARQFAAWIATWRALGITLHPIVKREVDELRAVTEKVGELGGDLVC